MATTKRKRAGVVQNDPQQILERAWSQLDAPTKAAMSALYTAAALNAIKVCKKRFETTKNPLYVWRAYQISHQALILPAPWIAEYLYNCAAQLLELSPPKNPKHLARDVMKACGLKGKGPNTFWARYKRDSKQVRAVLLFAQLKQKSPGMTDDAAYKQVGEEVSADERTINRWVKPLREFL